VDRALSVSEDVRVIYMGMGRERFVAARAFLRTLLKMMLPKDKRNNFSSSSEFARRKRVRVILCIFMALSN
jgi:hypothetical protein